MSDTVCPIVKMCVSLVLFWNKYNNFFHQLIYVKNNISAIFIVVLKRSIKAVSAQV